MKIELSNRCMICGDTFDIKNGVIGTLIFNLGDSDVGVPPYFALVCKKCTNKELAENTLLLSTLQENDKIKAEDLKFKAKIKEFENPLPVVSIDFFQGYVSVSEKGDVEVHSILFDKVEYIFRI